MTLAAEDALGHFIDEHIDVFSSVGTFDALRAGDTVQLHDSRLEVMCHAAEALCPDEFHVGVVGLVLGELPIDEALCDVEDHARLHGAVALQPPGILPGPHAQCLRVPRLEI